MLQYTIFLVLAPVGIVASLLAVFLPRVLQSYERFFWLKIYNYSQLCFLVVNTIELLLADPYAKQIFASLCYILIGSSASFGFLFGLEYTGLFRRYRAWVSILFVLPVLSCVCGFLNGTSGPVWKNLSYEQLDAFVVMKTGGYGPVALLTFVQCYSLAVCSALIVLVSTYRNHLLYKRQQVWITLGYVLPLVFNLVFIAKAIPGWNKDFSSIAGCFGGFVVTLGFLRYRTYSVVPGLRQSVLEQQDHGILVCDERGIIVDLNRAASRFCGRPESSLLGKQSDHLIEHLRQHFQLAERDLPRGDEIEGRYYEIRPMPIPRDVLAQNQSGGREAFTIGELRILEMLSLKLSNKEIGDRLGLSINTVKYHLGNLFRKTGCDSRAKLLAYIEERRVVPTVD